ncbi:MAG: hypothetical protein ACE5JZ_07355 [Kiloniellales bacterium]
MQNYSIVMGVGVIVLFGGSIYGIFRTKTPGFGKYTTSALVLTVVLFIAAFAFVLDKVEWTPVANLLFAVAGYAGGLITAKAGE